MKVQVPFDLNHDQRIAIGVAETGEFKLCTREEARSYISRVAGSTLGKDTGVVTDQRDVILEKIKGKLNE